MKHLDVLREARLVSTVAEGTRRINSLNVVPLQRAFERWVSKYQAMWAGALLDVKDDAEQA